LQALAQIACANIGVNGYYFPWVEVALMAGMALEKP